MAGGIKTDVRTYQMYINGEFVESAGKKMFDVYLERDETKRQEMLKALTREIVDKAPYIWLPVEYFYSAWWPWVKNYGGELRVGSERPGPIHARMWIDQGLKKKLGY